MKFPIFTAIAIMFSFLFFFLYIMFNYGFHDPTVGAFTKLDDRLDDDTGSFANQIRDLLNFEHSWFGTGMTVCVVMVIVCGFIDIVRSSKQSMQ